jgi:hypothetical protein
VLTGDGRPDVVQPPSPALTRTTLALGHEIPARDIASNAPRPGLEMFSEAMASEPEPVAEMVVEVVSTDPFAARLQVERFLTDNRMRYQPTDAPMPQPLDLADSQTGMASRLAQSNVKLKQAEPQFKVERMTRQDVASMCSQMLDGAKGQYAQVVQESPHRSRRDLSLQIPGLPAPINGWRSAAVERVQPGQASGGPAPGFELLAAPMPVSEQSSVFEGSFIPTTRPTDERVDVFIVVRGGAEAQAEQEPATQPAEDSPSDTPATGPSSP